jgi:hypothetical protein
MYAHKRPRSSNTINSLYRVVVSSATLYIRIGVKAESNSRTVA